MPDIPTIIGIIILVIVIIAILKIVKKMIKAVAIIASIIFIVLIVFTYLVYLDLNDINENFNTKQSMFIYQDDQGSALAGFYDIFGTDEDEIEYVSGDVLNSFTEKSSEEAKGDSYKLFIINQEAFDSVEAIQDFGGIKVNRLDAIFLIQSNDFMTDVEKTNLKEFGFSNVYDAKGNLFAHLYNEGLEQDKIFLFKEYKKGNVIIYPETIVFRFIKSVPNFLIDNIIKFEGE